jgi:hypothetical protein
LPEATSSNTSKPPTRSPAFGQVGDALRVPLRADTEAGKIARPARHDDHLLAALGDGRGGERGRRRDGPGGDACFGDE